MSDKPVKPVKPTEPEKDKEPNKNPDPETQGGTVVPP